VCNRAINTSGFIIYSSPKKSRKGEIIDHGTQATYPQKAAGFNQTLARETGKYLHMMEGKGTGTTNEAGRKSERMIGENKEKGVSG
jgi:hypothetical protein